VTLESGVWVDPKRMLQAIRDAGFTPVPENVRMTLTGVLELRDGGCVLKLDRMKTPMELPCVDRRHDGSAAHAPGESAGRVVEVRGRWIAEGAGALEVETISDAVADR